MRIAVPSTDDRGLDSYVSRHFGHTPYYTFIDVAEGKVMNVEVVPAPYREHWPGALPEFIKEHGGDVVLAYGVGRRALEYFEELGIKVVQGVHGRVGDVLQAFLEGRLRTDEGWREKEEFGDRGCRDKRV